MAHGAAHDAAQHIATTLVGGQHAIGDQEAGGTQMVGDDAVAHLVLAIGAGLGEFGRGLDQRPHQVDVVIVVLALHHGGDALKPHAGIDAGLGQRDALLLGHLLELHEHEIPDLDIAVAIGFRRTRRAAPDLVAVVVENLGTRTAGAGIAHGPEIVRRGDAHDALIGQAGHLLPQVKGLIIVVIDRHPQLVLGQAVFLGNQVPGQRDGLFLEIIAEGEVTEHFKEGVVAGGVADIVEVVMLAAGAHAFLRGRGAGIGALLLAGEHVLELHHAGIGEHQGRVIARHQRRGFHHRMAVLAEIIQEGLADIAGGGGHTLPLIPKSR
jgi:hypothetical protein